MNVYIVEDDIFHLEDIKITLEELGYVCIGSSDDPFEALDQIGVLLPDAVILVLPHQILVKKSLIKQQIYIQQLI